MGTQNKFIISGPEFEVPLPECSLAEYLLPKIRSQPKDNIIQIDSETGTSQTIGELSKISAGLAEGLVNIGLAEDDVVSLVTKNRHELYAIALATILAGGTVAPLDPKMTVYELKHMIGLIRPKYIFCEKETMENVEQALSSLGSDTKIISIDSKNEVETSHLSMQELIKSVDLETFKPRPVKSPSTQLAFIMLSSGSTGLPKGVGLSHENIISQIEVNKLTGKPFSQMTALQMPHFFWVSQTVTFLLSLVTGMKRLLLKNPTPENLLKAIHTHKITWGVFSPSTLKAITSHPDFKTKYDVSSIKVIQPVGAVLTESLINRIKEVWSDEITIQQIYGVTELSGLVTEADPSGKNMLSIGKLVPGSHLNVVDTETKKSLGPNKIGEFCFNSKGLMKGYVGNPEATKEAIDSDGWYHTGDLGYYDEDGNLYIVDRIKEIIKYQNMHVSPAELENLIETLPGVSEVGVVGIPNEKDGYHPMALIVKQKGLNVTEDEILQIVKENLSDCKQLRGGIKFVTSIPRTRTGKIKRKELKELAESLYYEK